MEQKSTTYYGLPEEVSFCKRCVISNQRPSSVIEFKHQKIDKKPTIFFDQNGVCQACHFSDIKREIDWRTREKELQLLCDKHRSKNGLYDCIVPGSGGKDSAYVSHILKTKYRMNPLTVTWAPHSYTDIGWKNFQRWIHAGFDNLLYTPNGRVHRLLTRLAFENLCHPFQPFIVGQRLIGPRFSALYNIPLVFYGENAAEYGNNIKDAAKPTMDMSFFYESEPGLRNLFLSGLPIDELSALHNISIEELNPYLPLDGSKLKAVGTEVHYFSYYVNWDPQENYYYAVENTGFKPNPERTEGSYSKYSSLDDKIDPLHYYTTYIKFGLGRASYDAAQEIRSGKITREEGIALVRRYDSEFPAKYFREILEYMDIDETRFWQIIDSSRSPHLWKKDDTGWKLRNEIY